jgi:hypothetical protein
VETTAESFSSCAMADSLRRVIGANALTVAN